jgi:predicted RNA-binding protein
MCLAKAFIRQDGEEKVVMDEIAHVTVNNGRLVFSTIFGQQEQIEALVQEIDFVHHVIILKRSAIKHEEFVKVKKTKR